jgi:hypothetical protein
MTKLVSVTFAAVDSKGSTKKSLQSKPMVMTEETARVVKAMLAEPRIGSGQIQYYKTGE